MPPLPGQEEALKRMTKIVNSLLARNDCAPFREPVDWRGLELYDYPQVISKMMDLGTIKRKLERGHYTTAHQVSEDVRLVWSNCMTYNSDGSDFWLLAKSYSRRFEDRYRKVKSEFDVGEDLDEEAASTAASTNKVPSTTKSVASNKDSGATDSDSPPSSSPGTPSLDARAKLGASLFLLSGSELGSVMTMIELDCPSALETWDKQKVEINVDALPSKLFASLNHYVTSKVGNRSLAGSPDLEEGTGSSKPKKKRKKE